MARHIFARVLALVVLMASLCTAAFAQVGNSCLGAIGNGTPIGGQVPIPGQFDCEVEGNWLLICAIWTYNCPPADAGPETCPTCGAAASSPAANKPIALASGNTYIKQTDVSIPGLSGGLTLTRTWNSLWPATQTAYQIGLFGPNWRSTFEERVFLGSDNYMKYGRSDGSFWSFGYATGGTWRVAAPANIAATLAMGSNYWTITFQNGEQRLFDNSSGHLIAIIDRNGNTTQLTYDAVGRLVTVTDPASRHLYFAYGNGSSYLVTGVTSDVSISVSYSYDTLGRLSQVIEPDGSTMTFQYDANSFISAVVDANGKILEAHAYDSSGHGLTASLANGVDAVTVSY